MTDATDLTRRAVLTIGGTGAVGGVLVLAGCAPGDADDAANSTPPPASPGSDASDGAAPETGTAAGVAALADVPVGGSVSVEIDGAPALLAQPTAGEVAAFSAICTHQQCVLAAAGDRFECPCHGSAYDAATGEVLQGPALDPLPAIPVHVEGDQVVAGA
ncbi:Rieske (2Fe-2S) protein [Agromyces sp. G08B096]|uniref:Cytochrome bc1 complex Rieske iron-sulfur subunit n=1 Tax=Agromyces sp. G08B096 TaxID=3156399 RepID=A0AAU7WDA3_9MICO